MNLLLVYTTEGENETIIMTRTELSFRPNINLLVQNSYPGICQAALFNEASS